MKKLYLSKHKNGYYYIYYNDENVKQKPISTKTKLTSHCLRNTFVSWLVQKGVSIYEVSKLLGYADIKTTQIYAHLRSDDLRNVGDRLD